MTFRQQQHDLWYDPESAVACEMIGAQNESVVGIGNFSLETLPITSEEISVM